MITVTVAGKIMTLDIQVIEYVALHSKWDFEDEIKNLEMQREALKSKIEEKRVKAGDVIRAASQRDSSFHKDLMALRMEELAKNRE